MSKPYFTLSDNDKSLRNSGRRVNHPSECGPLKYTLPPTTENIHVVAAYPDDERPEEQITCALCGQTENHLHGIVLDLGDGYFAPIGRICCNSHLGYNYQALMNAFDSGSRRKESLRRLMLAINSIEDVLLFIERLKVDPRLQVLCDLRNRFASRFGKLFDAAAAANGILRLDRPVVDDKKMTDRRLARESKANRYIDRETSRTGIEPTPAEVEAHFAGDPDFSKAPLMTTEKYVFEEVPATYFFTGLKNVMRDLDAKSAALVEALSVFHKRDSAEFEDTKQFVTGVAAYMRALNGVLDLIAKINDAMALFSATGDIRKVVAWAKRNHAVGLGNGNYDLEVGAVVYNFADGRTKYRLDYSTMESLPTGHLPALLAQLRPGKQEVEITAA